MRRRPEALPKREPGGRGGRLYLTAMHRPPRPLASRPPLPPDLGAGERAVAGRFEALARAVAPRSLEERCLAAPEDVFAGRGSVAARPAWRALGVPLAWAAALLLAVGLASLSSSTDGRSPVTEAGAPFVRNQVFEVVDDPSVPLFHAVETFDRLTPAPLVAWQGGSR